MSRFSSPEEASKAAKKAALYDYKLYKEKNNDLNPFCTPGARYDWTRGFLNKGPRQFESPNMGLYDTIYLRGQFAKKILDNNNDTSYQLEVKYGY